MCVCYAVFLFFRHGIRCNIIVPGNINTPMADIVDVLYPDFVEQLIKSLAINRKGKPEGNSNKTATIYTHFTQINGMFFLNRILNLLFCSVFSKW